MNRCKRYIVGAVNADGTPYSPTNPVSTTMIYEDHQFILKLDTVLNRLRLDLTKKMKEEDAEQFLREISDEAYDFGKDNLNPNAFDVFEFKIARFPLGREIIEEVMLRQVRYAVRTGKDMKEWQGEMLSEYASKAFKDSRMNLLHEGKFGYSVLKNPDPQKVQLPYTEEIDGWRSKY